MVLGVVSAMLGMIGSLAAWSVRESHVVTLRLATLEALANLMEEARTISYSDLTPAWAEKRAIPPALLNQIPGSTLSVNVVPEPSAPSLKRVTAHIEMRTAYSAIPHHLSLATIVPAPGEVQP